MASPLSGSLASAVYGAMKGLFLDAALMRSSTSGGTDYEPGAQSESSYPCKAIVEKYSNHFRDAGLVDQNDRKVLILTKSLSVVPRQGDRVVISGVTFTAIEVQTDPATAVWVIRGRM